MMANVQIASAAFKLSIVLPIFNEEAGCNAFFEQLLPVVAEVTKNFEIVCVNDGSTDTTLALLKQIHQAERRVKIITLTRNFGKDVALTAGIDRSTGDAIIPMDADLQDPPELIRDLVARWQQGFDTVVAVRRSRTVDSFWRRTATKAFYRILGTVGDIHIPADAGDFRLLDRCVVDALKCLPERNRFMKGLYSWVGFSQTTIAYDRQERHGGSSKWNFWSLWNFGLDGIFSFSTIPLRIWTYFGVCVAFFAAIYVVFIVVQTLVYGIEVPGYASLIVVILFFSGVNMIGLGMLGEYIGRISVEVKRRPLYLIRSTVGFGNDGQIQP